MGEYDCLYSQLRYWENEVSRLRKEKGKWEDRKKDIENVQRLLRSVANNSSSDVNGKIIKTSGKLDCAIEYPMKESAMDSIFSGKRETSVDGDSDLFCASGSLQNEIRICEPKIAELKNSISRAEGEVIRIQREINSSIWG